MEREYLEKLGLDDKVINLIMTEVEKSKEDDTDLKKELEQAKAEVQAKDAEIQTLTDEKTNSEKLINTLKNKTKDDEASQKLIQDYKTQIAQIQEQALKDRIHSKVILELVDQGCTDPELVSYLIKEDNISVNNDGSFTGISEQVQLLKNDEKRGIYFKSNEEQPQPTRGGYDPLASSDYSNYLDEIISNNTNSKADNSANDPILNILRERENSAYTEKGDPQAFWDSLE